MAKSAELSTAIHRILDGMSALENQIKDLDERISVLETVTADQQTEIDEISERNYEDGYLKKSQVDDGRPDGL